LGTEVSPCGHLRKQGRAGLANWASEDSQVDTSGDTAIGSGAADGSGDNGKRRTARTVKWTPQEGSHVDTS
jgi:hypothetical protein